MSHTILVCLGFAGSGASFFHPWRKIAPDGLEILAPQLPGREWRIDEDPPGDVGAAVEMLLPEVVSAGAGQRVALFGQCFGAIVAFELARRLSRADGPQLVHLFPSGSQSPWAPRARWATGSDDELVRRVREDIGYDHEALAVPELRELILPALRADMESHERYVAPAGEPLGVPVTALRGRRDPVVSAGEARGWSRASTGSFALIEFDGPHMYLIDEAEELLTVIAKAVGT
ncbi:thioesterase II family protein [Plantactinospora sp. WMMB334]|uniref:thioesterase II family protein n=1 Tax=Plantactinospora sp. WMMB334 TaxID=3404119 RepID=UPI003B92EBB1